MSQKFNHGLTPDQLKALDEQTSHGVVENALAQESLFRIKEQLESGKDIPGWSWDGTFLVQKDGNEDRVYNLKWMRVPGST